MDIEKRKEYLRKYAKTEKRKESQRIYETTSKRKEWRKKYKKRILSTQEGRDKQSGYISNWRKKNPEKTMLIRTKNRARKYDVPFNLTISDIHIPKTCPVFGTPLKTWDTCRRESPSLDKIVPQLGYVKGNIQVISMLANLMKQDASPDELLMFADWIYKTYKLSDQHSYFPH